MGRLNVQKFLRTKPVKAHRGSRVFRSLHLERLEDRLTPAVIFWQGGAAGTNNSWNAAANWVGNVVPGAQDTAVFDQSPNDVVLTANVSIAGVTITSNYQATVRLNNNALKVTSQFDASGATVFQGSVILSTATANV
jgi:hypothetical protein